MGRPAKTDRPVHKKLSLPQSVVARVDLMLYSEVEQRVPHAAWSDYVVRLIKADLDGKGPLIKGKWTVEEVLSE